MALIVEDDAGQRELGAMMLREFDLEVEEAGSAEEAIDLLRDRSGTITILLADVNLPGPLDGIGLAHRVSVLWPTVSVIITSGDVTRESRTLPPRAAFVAKPWRALDIVAAADRAVRASHQLQAVPL